MRKRILQKIHLNCSFPFYWFYQQKNKLNWIGRRYKKERSRKKDYKPLNYNLLKIILDGTVTTTQKMKFSIEDFFSKCDQIRRKLRIWSHLLKKWLIGNFIFCTVNKFQLWRHEIIKKNNQITLSILTIVYAKAIANL